MIMDVAMDLNQFQKFAEDYYTKKMKKRGAFTHLLKIC